MRVSIAWTLVAFCAVVAVPGEVDISAQNSNTVHKRARVAKLRAHQATEVVPDEMWITTDSDGRRKITMSGPLEKGRVERLFWIVDGRDNSYQILRLTKDDNKDARRLRKAYQRLGVELPEETIAERLTRVRTADEEAQRNFTDQSRSPDGGPGDLEPEASEFDENGRRIHGPAACDDQWVHSCRGFGRANVQTWEPARYLFNVLHLNETQAAASWTKNITDAFISTTVSRSGYCWANPQTFAFTHWYTTFCQQYYNNYGHGFDLARVGNYVNFDFAMYLTGTPRAISITAEASVQSYNGMGNWGAQYWEDTQDTLRQFYEPFFLSGVISGAAWEGDCVSYCSPDYSVVSECENRGIPGTWDYDLCQCVGGYSPIIIDLKKDGLALTSAHNGVTFDLTADGQLDRVAWTQGAADDDAFLALDRNGNGRIDNGAELFGNFTEQPVPRRRKHGPNGFLALAVFDEPANGGNGDGQITDDDTIAADLRLWVDLNHDGISQEAELASLDHHGVRAISLHYVPGKRRDEFGNVYRFRGHVTMDRDASPFRSTQRQAIDVFLADLGTVAQQP